MEMSDKHGAHNHPTRDLKIQINKLRQLFLNEAQTVEDETLHEIHKDVSLAHPRIASKLPYKKMEPGMRNRRKRQFPNIPKNLEEVDKYMANAPLGLSENYRGLIKLEGELLFSVVFK